MKRSNEQLLRFMLYLLADVRELLYLCEHYD